MAEPICQPELTREARHLMALLRQGPQSVAGLAGALQTSAGQMDDVFQGLGRTVGLAPLFRFDTLRYGLMDSRSNRAPLATTSWVCGTNSDADPMVLTLVRTEVDRTAPAAPRRNHGVACPTVQATAWGYSAE